MTSARAAGRAVASTGGAHRGRGALWATHPPHGFPVVPAVLCVLVLALATRVEFDTPFGYTVPTQMAFVPLVFVVPLALVPLAVVVALCDRPARQGPPGRDRAEPRCFGAIPNSWFAIGPVAVFAIADVEPRNAGAALLIAALVAEFVVDFLVARVQDVITGRPA